MGLKISWSEFCVQKEHECKVCDKGTHPDRCTDACMDECFAEYINVKCQVEEAKEKMRSE